MEWFIGTFDDALSEYLQKKGILIVFVYAENDENSTKLDDLLRALDISVFESIPYVAIRMVKESENAKQFAKFFPTLNFTTCCIFGVNGRPIEIISYLSGITSDKFLDVFKSAVSKFKKQMDEEKKYVDIPEDKNGTGVGKENVNGTESKRTESLFAKMEWFIGTVADALTEYQQKKGILIVFVYAEDDENSSRLNDLLGSLDISVFESIPYVAIRLDKESENANLFARFFPTLTVPICYILGMNVQPLEVITDLSGITSDKLLDVFKSAVLLFKEQIGEVKKYVDIPEDENRTGIRKENVSGTEKKVKMEVNKPLNSDECRIQCRYPGGEILINSFRSNEPLQVVYDAVNEDTRRPLSFVLVQPSPHKKFTDNEMNKSLLELGLTPTALLLVVLASKPPDEKHRELCKLHLNLEAPKSNNKPCTPQLWLNKACNLYREGDRANAAAHAWWAGCNQLKNFLLLHNLNSNTNDMICYYLSGLYGNADLYSTWGTLESAYDFSFEDNLDDYPADCVEHYLVAAERFSNYIFDLHTKNSFKREKLFYWLEPDVLVKNIEILDEKENEFKTIEEWIHEGKLTTAVVRSWMDPAKITGKYLKW